MVQDFKNLNPDHSSKLKLNHVLNSMTYGEKDEQESIKQLFGPNKSDINSKKLNLQQLTKDDHTAFDMMDFVDDSLYYLDQEQKDYFYFFKIIPHIFVDEFSTSEFNSFSYSLNHNSKTSQLVQLPIITMTYDFAPIAMKISK